MICDLSTAVLVELRNEAKNLKDEPIAKEKPQYHISCQLQVNRTIRNVKSGSSGNNTLTPRKRFIFWTQQAAVLKDPAAFPSTLTPFALSLSPLCSPLSLLLLQVAPVLDSSGLARGMRGQAKHRKNQKG